MGNKLMSARIKFPLKYVDTGKLGVCNRFLTRAIYADVAVIAVTGIYCFIRFGFETLPAWLGNMLECAYLAFVVLAFSIFMCMVAGYRSVKKEK